MEAALKNVTEMEHRTFELELDTRGKSDNLVVNASLSSETPVERGLREKEVLVHTEEAVDLGRARDGLPLLFNHDHNRPIGLIENVRLVGRRLVGRLRFRKSALAREVWEDVRDGVLKFMSIGYQVHRTEPGDGSVYRVVLWEPHEASVVAVPGDATVGIGRSSILNKRKSNMSTPETETETPPADAPDDPPANRRTIRGERQRASEIMALGRRHNLADEAEQAVADGWSVRKFQNLVLDSLEEGTPLDNSPATRGGLPVIGQRTMDDYKISNVVRAQIMNDWSQAGFEREVGQELQRSMGRAPDGIFVPQAALATRDVTKAGSGGNLVGTTHMDDMFIENLRNETVIMRLGARSLTGLVGDASIPRRTSSVSVETVGEGVAPAQSDPAFDSVNMSPITIAGFAKYSRKMLLQGLPAIEDLLRDDLRQEIAIQIDRLAINGTGQDDEPVGILNTTGIGNVEIDTNGGPITWDDVVDVVKEVAIDDAAIENLWYLTNHKVSASMRKTPRQASGQEGQFILPADVSDRLAGYALALSNIVPSDLTKGTGTGLSALLFGNFRDILLGFWSGVDLLVNPYTEQTEGNVIVSAHQDFDVALRHPQSFAAVQDIVTE